jgi:hypothetical protein
VASEVDGQELDVLIAGDDQGAEQKVSQLVSTAACGRSTSGRSPAHSSSTSSVLHISLQQPHNLNFGSAIKLRHPAKGA